MNQIETARIIRDQGGNCCKPIGIDCYGKDGCPAVGRINGHCGFNFELNPEEKLQWFTNWLAENDKENVMSDKIQHTEGEWRKIIRVIHGDCQEDDHDEEHYLNNLKKSGYIVKSELQQKVEEAENFIDQKIEVIKTGIYPIITNIQLREIKELIQLLKKDHPEFKP